MFLRISDHEPMTQTENITEVASGKIEKIMGEVWNYLCIVHIYIYIYIYIIVLILINQSIN